MKKRIISVILSLAVVLSMFVVPTAFAEGKDYSRDIEIMKSLDMFSAVDSTNSENLVTRAEFAALVDLLLDIDVSNMKQVYFSDVNETHEYFEYISAAANAGIIQGHNGKFNPDNVIKYSEAAAMLVNALGGKPAAEYEGAYAGGYIKLADDLGIKKNVPVSSETEINVGMAARLLLNTGNTEIFTPLFTSDNVKIEKGSTLFWAKHKIDSGKGVLTANEYTSIDDGATAKENSVRIGTDFGGKIYYNSKVSSCIGQYVEYYFSEENDENIIYYLEPVESKNNVVTTTETEFNRDSNIMLYTVNGKDKKIAVKPETVVLYNGVRTFQYYIGTNNDECIFDIVNGEMQLIDNNADGKYEVISIIAFQDYFISGINVNDGIVYDSYGLADLDFANAESNGDDWVITDEKGNIIDYTELAEKDVVSVAKSMDGRILRGVLSQTKAKADLTRKYSLDGILYVHIGDTKYEMLINEKLKKDRQAKIDELKAAGTVSPVVTYADVLPASGTNVTAYIDYMGKIAAIEMGRTLSGYGFVIKKHYDDSEEKYSLRLLTQDGSKDKIALAKTVRIDGETYREKDGSLNSFMSTFNDYQMVLYKLNGDDELTMIDTVASNKKDSNDVLRVLKDVGSDGKVSEVTFYNTQNSLYGQYSLASEVVGFTTPANDPSIKYDLNLYSAGDKPSGFGTKYKCLVYSSQKDSFLADCVQIVTGDASDSYSRSANDMLVSSVVETLDADDIPVLRFTGYHNGTEVSYNLSANYVYASDSNGAIDAKTIVPGDFIKFTTNAKSEITYTVPIKRMGTPEALGQFAADYTGTEQKGWFSTLDFYLFSGYLQSREGNYLGIVKHKTQLSENFVQPDAIFMVQDKTPIYYVKKRGTEGSVTKYEKADIGVMGTYQNNRVQGEIFCICRNANLEMVIYYEQ